MIPVYLWAVLAQGDWDAIYTDGVTLGSFEARLTLERVRDRQIISVRAPGERT